MRTLFAGLFVVTAMLTGVHSVLADETGKPSRDASENGQRIIVATRKYHQRLTPDDYRNEPENYTEHDRAWRLDAVEDGEPEKGLELQRHIVRMLCRVGAYNFIHRWYLATRGAEITALAFPAPDLDIAYDENEETHAKITYMRMRGFIVDQELINSDFDPETRTISVHHPWRGLGDASGDGRWKLEGNRPSLQFYEVDASFDGKINPVTVFDASTIQPVIGSPGPGSSPELKQSEAGRDNLDGPIVIQRKVETLRVERDGTVIERQEKTPDAPQGRRAETGPKQAHTEPSLIAQHAAWGAYSYTKDGKTTCYILSMPLSKTPVDRDHGNVFFTLTHHKVGSRLEPQLKVGYRLPQKDISGIEIGNRNFRMFTKGSDAWLAYPADETRVVEAMKQDGFMIVNAESLRGTKTQYEFNLSGVSAALAELSECHSENEVAQRQAERRDARAVPVLIAKHGGWAAYHYDSGDKKSCFVQSRARFALPADKDHGDVFFTLGGYDNLEAYQPQFMVGYAQKQDHRPTLLIDGRKFPMFARGYSAWLSSPADEVRVVNAMKQGGIMLVDAQTQSGDRTQYQFDLEGVADALAALDGCDPRGNPQPEFLQPVD